MPFQVTPIVPDVPAIAPDVPSVPADFPTIPSQFSFSFIRATIGAEIPDIQSAVPVIPVQIADVSAQIAAIFDPVGPTVQAKAAGLLSCRT